MFDLNRDKIGDIPVQYKSSLAKLMEDQELVYLFLSSPSIFIYEKINQFLHRQEIVLEDPYPLMSDRQSDRSGMVVFGISVYVSFWKNLCTKEEASLTYIWKEWKELSRGKGLWLALSMAMIISVLILWQSKSLPSDQGFEVFLLSLYEMNVFLIPLLSLFIASFAVIQEKEQKTLMILLTKRESYRSFFVKKSIGVQFITISMFLLWYFALAIPMKFMLVFDVSSFLVFLLSFLTLLFIFNQIGLFLGSICENRMQLVGANIFTWFFFIFLARFIVSFFSAKGNRGEYHDFFCFLFSGSAAYSSFLSWRQH